MIELDIDGAIAAHLEWKKVFVQAVEQSNAAHLEHVTVCDDTKCVVGQWMGGDGQRYAADERFQQACDSHRLFHAVCCQILHLLLAEDFDSADKLLKEDFERVSQKVIAQLESLRAL